MLPASSRTSGGAFLVQIHTGETNGFENNFGTGMPRMLGIEKLLAH